MRVELLILYTALVVANACGIVFVHIPFLAEAGSAPGWVGVLCLAGVVLSITAIAFCSVAIGRLLPVFNEEAHND